MGARVCGSLSSSELDLVGFWIDNGKAAEVLDEPLDHLGAASITWIIRWRTMVQRNARVEEVFTCTQCLD